MHRRPSGPSRPTLVVALVALSLAVTGCSAGEVAPSSDTRSATPPSTEAPPADLTGTVGAAHFDDGYLRIGSGEKVVDLFIDPLCPYCRLFEQGSGQLLFDDAAAGLITLRVHPLALLNRLSQGTDYSTRSAAALVAVAAEHPDATPQFVRALFDEQPDENTTGLDDAQLTRIAASIGVELDLADARTASYRAWVDRWSRSAVSGPLAATTDIPAIDHVPTVVVEGTVFDGASTEAEAFAAFYREHTS